jgi:hypothetical protein
MKDMISNRDQSRLTRRRLLGLASLTTAGWPPHQLVFPKPKPCLWSLDGQRRAIYSGVNGARTR